MKQQEKKQLTKTPQELVHIKHTISVRQYKYWFLLLKAYKELLDSNSQTDKDGFYSVSLSDISNLMGYEPVKKELKSDLEALRQQPIIINYLEKDGKTVTHGMGFLSEWKVTSTKISFKLPSFIEKVVQEDLEAKQMFLLLNWDIFNSFNGKYEAIIYKLCKDYIGVRRTPYFTIEEYRGYIGLNDDEYKDFKSLNRRTLSEPIKNINKNKSSDILVEVEFDRQGRKVVGLYFTMEYKEKNAQLIEIAPIEPNPAFEKSLITIPLNKQLEYLGQFSEEQIKAIIDRANDYIDKLKSDSKKASVGAIYNKAFAESWGLENFEAEQKEKAKAEERKRQAKAEREAEAKAQKEREELIKKEKEIKNYCIDIFWKLEDEQQTEIIEIVKQRINPISLISFLEEAKKKDKNLWDNPIYYVQLKDILKEKNMI